MMPQNNITNLVFQGGSVKGIAYIGALEILENEIDLSQIKRVAGTSAGAITAALLAFGFSVAEVKTLLSEFDFKALLDDKAFGIPTQGKILKTVEKSESGVSSFFAKIPAKAVKLPLMSRLSKQLGVYEGEYFRLWAEKLIQEQVQKITKGKYTGEYLTFGELHKLTQEYPGQFRDLFVIGSNFSLQKKEVFSYENPHTENAIISDAIRISMSIPYLFKPHHMYCKIDNERLVDTKRHLWVDGGVYDNYPIRCFDNTKYLENTPVSKSFYNPETLGFRLVEKEHKNYFEGLNDKPENQVNRISAFIKTMLNTNFHIQEEIYSQEEHKERTVYIDHLGISMFAFNLSKEQQEGLIQSGKKATETYFKGQSNLLVPTINPTTDESIPEEENSLFRL
ncbi:MAG: hypothetical protein LEGION0398_MBIBDBAK_00765 [Legionellaceae bacterium]